MDVDVQSWTEIFTSPLGEHPLSDTQFAHSMEVRTFTTNREPPTLAMCIVGSNSVILSTIHIYIYIYIWRIYLDTYTRCTVHRIYFECQYDIMCIYTVLFLFNVEISVLCFTFGLVDVFLFAVLFSKSWRHCTSKIKILFGYDFQICFISYCKIMFSNHLLDSTYNIICCSNMLDLCSIPFVSNIWFQTIYLSILYIYIYRILNTFITLNLRP